MSRNLGRLLNVADFRERAQAKMPRPIFDFLDGGAEDEKTLDRNRRAFDDYALLPRVLRDVGVFDPSTTIMGVSSAWPLIVAPTGMPGIFHPDGEIAVARAAADVGSPYCLSMMASRSIEDLADATSGPKFLQVYLFKDRAITRELIQRAKTAGFDGLILAVDMQVAANRERDRRSGFAVPPRPTLATIAAMMLRPHWCWNTLVRRPVKLANFQGMRAEPGTTLLQFINDQFDPKSTWRDLEWVQVEWGGPVAIKGLLAPADVAMACEGGSRAVILSNHGGRQLDGAVAPLDILPHALEAASGRAEIILDGGIRRGTDMIKALSLGASACMTGRPGLYGLAAGGQAGVKRVLDLLRQEFVRDLQMMGITAIDQLDRSNLFRPGLPPLR